MDGEGTALASFLTAFLDLSPSVLRCEDGVGKGGRGGVVLRCVC